MKKVYKFKTAFIFLGLLMTGLVVQGQMTITTDNIYNVLVETPASTYRARIAYTISGTGTITEKGVCIGTANPPLIGSGDAVKIADVGIVIDSSSVVATTLTAAVTYYVRAYVISGGSPVYGDATSVISFTTGSTALVTYNCDIRNDVLNTSSEYEFDIYIYRTGSTELYLNNYQLGLELADTNNLHNSFMTGEYVATTSELDAGFTPPSTLLIAYQAAPYPHMDVRINGLTPSGNGMLITQSPGKRIGSFKLHNWTNSSKNVARAFGSTTPNLIWDDDFVARTYIYAIYPPAATGTAMIITNLSSHVAETTNPMLNAANWRGGTSTDWSNTANWLACPTGYATPPTIADNAYIPGSGVTNNPTVSTTTTNEVNNLTISSGRALTIASDGGLKVNGTLTNNAGTSGLVIQSGSGGTGSLLHNTNSVNATIQRYITGSGTLSSMKYHCVSVPLTSAATPTSNLFLGSYLYNFDESTNAWVNMGTPTTTSLDVTRGYMIYYPGSNSTLSFTGPLNNGSFTALTTGSINDNTHGWNLVPNPYPASLDWKAVSGWVKTNIDDAIYIWNSSASTTNYASYVGVTSTNGGSQYIAPGQSFFVHANAGSPVLTMDNNVRLHNPVGFMKNTQVLPNLLRINTVANNMTDEIVIRFAEGASTGFDGNWDAYKLQGGDDSPQLSSIASDNNNLSINTLPFSTGNVTVPLGFSFSSATDASFTTSGMESFNHDVSIYLEDLILDKLINLRKNPVYTFSYQTDNPVNRFQLHFAGAIGIEDHSANAGKAFISKGNIFIEVPDMEGHSADISIYTLLGQMLRTDRRLMNGLVKVEAPQSAGIYIIQVASADQHFVTKVFNKQ